MRDPSTRPEPAERGVHDGVRGQARRPRTVSLVLALIWLVAGCGHFMHHEADEIWSNAEGQTGIDKLIGLTTTMEKSVAKARDDEDYQAGLDTLHHQFHALKKGFCHVTEAEAAQPSYVTATTLRREMRTVFHRLWKFRERRDVRNAHLDVFATRLRELRETLRAVKG